jgi:predicted RNA-binding protein Jag
MKNPQQFAQKLLELMGFDDYALEIDEEHRHAKINIRDHPVLLKEHLPAFLESLNHIAQLIAKKEEAQPFFFDVNNYRRERESIIAELARAAARKASVTKEHISLPAMNSYERRLIHVELAGHPGVITESVGKGKMRYVIIKPIEAGGVSVAQETIISSEEDPQ